MSDRLASSAAKFGPALMAQGADLGGHMASKGKKAGTAPARHAKHAGAGAQVVAAARSSHATRPTAAGASSSAAPRRLGTAAGSKHSQPKQQARPRPDASRPSNQDIQHEKELIEVLKSSVGNDTSKLVRDLPHRTLVTVSCTARASYFTPGGECRHWHRAALHARPVVPQQLHCGALQCSQSQRQSCCLRRHTHCLACRMTQVAKNCRQLLTGSRSSRRRCARPRMHSAARHATQGDCMHLDTAALFADRQTTVRCARGLRVKMPVRWASCQGAGMCDHSMRLLCGHDCHLIAEAAQHQQQQRRCHCGWTGVHA